MSVSCKKCGTNYSHWNVLAYLFNYLEPYIMCSDCKNDTCVELKHQSKISLTIKIILILFILALSFFLASKLVVPTETLKSDEYLATERGQLYAKLRSPFVTLIVLSCISTILTFFLAMPLHRYLNWRSFKQEATITNTLS